MVLMKPGLKTVTAFLAIVWLLIQVSVLLQFGIVTKGESLKYTNEAIYFNQHLSFSQPKYIFYCGYIIVRWIDLILKTGNLFTYSIQITLNFLSLLVFFRFSTKVFEDYLTGGLATTLVLLCLPWQNWTAHLYTESIFLSVSLVFGCYLMRGNKSRKDWYKTVGLLLLLVFLRPTGLLFIPVVGIWIWLRNIKSRNWAIIVGLPIGAGLCFYVLLNYAMKGEGEFDFMKPFIEEHLICGVPTNNRNDLLLSSKGNSIEGLVYYIVHNFQHFCSLAIKKSALFFAMIRPYYSASHNLVLQLFFYPLYLLAILGSILGWAKYRGMVQFCMLSVLMFAFSVVLSCDDWLNRFIMPVLPFIILMSVTGIKELKTRWLLND